MLIIPWQLTFLASMTYLTVFKNDLPDSFQNLQIMCVYVCIQYTSHKYAEHRFYFKSGVQR